MTQEEIKVKRAQLEVQKKVQQEKLSYLKECKRSAIADAEREVEDRYRKSIQPIENRISAIDEDMVELQSSCPKRNDKDEHGEDTTCSLCGEICANLDD